MIIDATSDKIITATSKIATARVFLFMGLLPFHNFLDALFRLGARQHHLAAAARQRFAQQIPESGRNAAHARHRQVCGITAQVTPGEIGETPRNHIPDIGTVQMRMDERRERRQKTVGVRFPVNPANDLLIGQSVRREKLVPQGNIPLEDTVNEVAPQRRAAALPSNTTPARS